MLTVKDKCEWEPSGHLAHSLSLLQSHRVVLHCEAEDPCVPILPPSVLFSCPRHPLRPFGTACPPANRLKNGVVLLPLPPNSSSCILSPAGPRWADGRGMTSEARNGDEDKEDPLVLYECRWRGRKPLIFLCGRVCLRLLYICKKRDKKEKKKEIEQFVGYILKSRYLPYMYIMHNL